MPTPTTSTPVLPIARVALRICVVLNWLMAAAIVVLLLAMPNRQWIVSAFDLAASPDANRVVWALRIAAMLGLVVVPLNYVVLTRLMAIVDTVRDGDPFVADNAKRLETIARCMLVLQIISIIIGAIGRSISTPAHPVDLDAGFSINGWLAVLLTFLLARVFAVGTRLRDDVAGTV